MAPFREAELGVQSVHFGSVAHLCLTLCNPMDYSTPGLPLHQQHPEFTQTHCPLSRWCHPTISYSVIPFFCLQTFQASGSFQMSQFVISHGQSIGVSASASVLPMNIQGWFPLGWTGWISLQSKGLSRVFSSTTVEKHQFFGTQPSLWSNSYIHTTLHHTGKTIALTRRTFVVKEMSLLFNMLSRFVIVFIPRSKHLLISWLQVTICSDFGVQENEVFHCFHCFPIYLPWSDGTRCHDLHFLNVEF